MDVAVHTQPPTVKPIFDKSMFISDRQCSPIISLAFVLASTAKVAVEYPQKAEVKGKQIGECTHGRRVHVTITMSTWFRAFLIRRLPSIQMIFFLIQNPVLEAILFRAMANSISLDLFGVALLQRQIFRLLFQRLQQPSTICKERRRQHVHVHSTSSQRAALTTSSFPYCRGYERQQLVIGSISRQTGASFMCYTTQGHIHFRPGLVLCNSSIAIISGFKLTRTSTDWNQVAKRTFQVRMLSLIDNKGTFSQSKFVYSFHSYLLLRVKNQIQRITLLLERSF